MNAFARRLVPVLLVVAAVSATAPNVHAAVQTGNDDVASAFTDAQQYTWGSTRRALLLIERAVIDALQDPTATSAIEPRLIELLSSPKSTRAARVFACRQLTLVGSSDCVPTVAGFLDDPEIGHMARSVLEVIPSSDAFVALQIAATDGSGVATDGARHSLARRRAWIAALGNMGSPDDVPMLLALGAGGEPVAATSLARMRGRGVDEAIGRAAEGTSEATAVVAIALLGERGAVSQRPVLERLAGEDHASSVRVAALIATADIGDWRQETDRRALLASAIDAADSADSAKAALAAVGRLGDPTLLPMVQQQMHAGQAPASAAMVVIALAEALEPTDRAAAKAAVIEVLERFTGDEAVRARAGEAMAQIERSEGYIERWAIAGPFIDEAAGSDLLDVAFPPERDDASVTWRTLEKSELSPPGIVNLTELLGGGDRCAYGRVVVTSNQAQDARLELGSDDSVKVWVNGEVVHSNAAMRGLTLRQDTAPIHLRRGENIILVKVTQGGGDWGFAVRMRDPDGLALSGVD